MNVYGLIENIVFSIIWIVGKDMLYDDIGYLFKGIVCYVLFENF